MAAALTPRVRIMVICDKVRRSKVETDVFDLRGVRQGMTVQAFPFVPAQLWLFLLLSSPRPGVFPGYFRVICDRTDRAVYYAHLAPSPSFMDNDQTTIITAPIRCAFPEEGRYTIQVSFFQSVGSDIVKGEMPFLFETNES